MSVTYKGYTIDINAAYRFVITGAGLEKNLGNFPSFDGAKAAVDSYTKVAAKTKTLKLEIMNAAGKEFVITGLNMHTGNITTKPATTEEYTYSDEQTGIPANAYYPRGAKILALIAEVKKLYKELDKKQNQLTAMQIRYDRGRVDAENYARNLEDILKEYQEAEKAAQKL